MSKLYVSHAEYDDLCDRVIEAVFADQWRPDFILGVSRGGLRLADALSRAFRCPMAVVAASSYGGEAGMEQGVLQMSPSVATVTPLQGGVLLADDLVDSGVTLSHLIQRIPTLCQATIDLRTAVIWVKPKAKFRPDYHAVHMQEDRWIVQPFERLDLSDDPSS